MSVTTVEYRGVEVDIEDGDSATLVSGVADKAQVQWKHGHVGKRPMNDATGNLKIIVGMTQGMLTLSSVVLDAEDIALDDPGTALTVTLKQDTKTLATFSDCVFPQGHQIQAQQLKGEGQLGHKVFYRTLTYEITKE